MRDGETITLSGLTDVLADFETRFGNNLRDTHFFASGNGINALMLLCEKNSRLGDANGESLHLRSLAGIQIWHDPAVAPNEIEMGRIEYRDGQPRKVVTKVFQIA